MGADRHAVRAFYEDFPFPMFGRGTDQDNLIALGKTLAAVWSDNLDRSQAHSVPITWLDLGCGTGEILCGIAAGLPEGSRVIGLDFTVASLELARRLARERGFDSIEFVHGDIQEAGKLLGGRKVDAISANGSLHHTEDPEALFKQTLDLLTWKQSTYVLGLYSALNRGPLDRVNRALSAIVPDPFDKHARLAAFKEIFLYSLQGDQDLEGLKMRFGSPEAIPDQWLLDTFCHPLENAYDMPNIMRWTKDTRLEFAGWLGMEPVVENALSSPTARPRIEALNEAERLRLYDLLDGQRFRFWLLRQRGE